VILDGVPAGLEIACKSIDHELARRQAGHGRGERMRIERDSVELLGGVLAGQTTGAPVVFRIANLDGGNWKARWEAGDLPPVPVPRPGHADWAGMRKLGLDDARPILERASARETAARVAAGAVAKLLLRRFDIEVGSHVESIGDVEAPSAMAEDGRADWPSVWSRAEESPVRCADAIAGDRMMRAIDAASEAGESLGGTFCVAAVGVPAGLGSFAQWDLRLDAELARALVSIPAIKGVEIGRAFANARRVGTAVHDGWSLVEGGDAVRATNRAGGVEGGMSNGEPIVVRAAMKPIPTTVSPQVSVDVRTGRAARTAYERSDVCAVPAAAVVGEAMVAWTIAVALRDKLGGDGLDEMMAHHRSWGDHG